jgi:hypothetical protein
MLAGDCVLCAVDSSGWLMAPSGYTLYLPPGQGKDEVLWKALQQQSQQQQQQQREDSNRWMSLSCCKPCSDNKLLLTIAQYQ